MCSLLNLLSEQFERTKNNIPVLLSALQRKSFVLCVSKNCVQIPTKCSTKLNENNRAVSWNSRRRRRCFIEIVFFFRCCSTLFCCVNFLSVFFYSCCRWWLVARVALLPNTCPFSIRSFSILRTTIFTSPAPHFYHHACNYLYWYIVTNRLDILRSNGLLGVGFFVSHRAHINRTRSRCSASCCYHRFPPPSLGATLSKRTSYCVVWMNRWWISCVPMNWVDSIVTLPPLQTFECETIDAIRINCATKLKAFFRFAVFNSVLKIMPIIPFEPTTESG